MAENDITIEVKNVSKAFRVYKDKSHTFKDRILFHRRNRYEKHQVLHDMSFTVHKGQAVGLIGHNGCGKSTTLKLLNRILYPDEGKILMHGRISSLIELGAGFHPDMSGRENIFINASIFGLKKNEIDDRLADIIRFSELEKYIDNPVRTYSSGMYMRLAFAIAINVDADILLVDEILAVGDANFQKKCFDKLREIKKNGATIVIVSHSMDQIKGICDRVIWIEDGRIREDGDAVHVTDEYLLAMRKTAEEREKKEREEIEADMPEHPNIKYPPKYVAGEQCSIYAYRKGSMLVRFRQIRMLNMAGALMQNFRGGDGMQIQFELETDQGAPGDLQYNILFNILKNDGTLCTTFVVDQQTGELRRAGDPANGIFEIEALTLAKGEYILDAVIVDREAKECDLLGHLIEFEVQIPERFGIGLAAMKNRWVFTNSRM